jgi:hypothetical protein
MLTSGDGTGNYTFTITGTGFYAGVTAKLLTTGGTELILIVLQEIQQHK